MTDTKDRFFTLPRIGAQIFIEPGQTTEEIDRWFRLMQEHRMSMCRIRMFENYMHKEDGTWDFSLFDLAFKAAEKYGIRIFATIFPATPFSDVGGFKFPKSDEHLASITDYIKHLVLHFKTFSSLYGWVLINEPGLGRPFRETESASEEFSRKKFSEWKAGLTGPLYKSNGYTTPDYADEKFLVDYTTWFLTWLADEIKKHDPFHHLHVNNHHIFRNIAEYDFIQWRTFLSSLGGSAHASWHYGWFSRDQYALAMAANCEIVRSGAGRLPWFITEIQGGNNTYSGLFPMCPTKEEVSQWLWSIIGTGGKGGIFWCFNPRGSGREAGEWAMIDFHDEPSDRLTASSEVAGCVHQHEKLFSEAVPVESGISILYTRESLWIERDLEVHGGAHYEGRAQGGVMKSALGFYEVLGEMGFQCSFRCMDEFDFTKSDYSGQVIILAHQVSIPSRHWKNLQHFAESGGKIIADGLTAFYDENAHCIMKTGFPLAGLFGGSISEFKIAGNLFDLKMKSPALTLPAHCLKGTIRNEGGKIISEDESGITGIRNRYGRGESVWIPSLIGLGGRLKGYDALAVFLSDELTACAGKVPVRFKKRIPQTFMHTLKTEDGYITIIINKSKKKTAIRLFIKEKLIPTILFADKQGKVSDSGIIIHPEETIVVYWKQ